jgi:anti-sigma regulatory factor (Ser/Thr protein kinase)
MDEGAKDMAAGKSFDFALKNELSELAVLCEHLERIGAELGLSRKCLFEVNLALDELFTNIISYGFPDGSEHLVRVRVAVGEETLTVTIEDDGVAFNPLKRPPPDLPCSLAQCKIGGLGIHLAKNLMDGISYRRRGGKNVLTLRKTMETDETPARE